MALHLEVKANTNQDADAATTAATAATDDRSGKNNATPANHHNDDEKPMTTAAAAVVDIDDDELFELDITLLDGRSDDDGHGHRRHPSHSAAVAVAVAAADYGAEHALLANCILPVQSVSSAVPVPASSVLSLYHPYSGYYSSRRLIFTAGSGDSRRRFLGRSAGRFCFSSRGFETMGSYFQRY